MCVRIDQNRKFMTFWLTLENINFIALQLRVKMNLKISKLGVFFFTKLDGVGPFDNRPSTDKLHHFVQKKERKKEEEKKKKKCDM